ncbi:MAG: hypothetical protein K8R88_09435 [Armatimonadetes bacterium]|nr:hypothetical protein [Armatimonadota bacterium]
MRTESRSFGDHTVIFSFSDSGAVAKCGFATVELYCRQQEVGLVWVAAADFRKSPQSFGGYSGTEHAERPSDDEFIALAMRMFRRMESRGEL